MAIKLYTGDTGDLPTNYNYRNYSWNDLVLFSIAEKGNAVTAHFTAKKRGLRYLRDAINEFVEHVFKEFKWCRMVLALVNPELTSVQKLIQCCDFQLFATHENYLAFCRLRGDK